MLESKAAYYKILAEKIIEKLILRNMEGYYAATKEEALELVKEKFLTQGVSAAWGGLHDHDGDRAYGLSTEW